MFFCFLFLSFFHYHWPVLKAEVFNLASFMLFISCAYFVSASSRLGHEQTSIHPNPYHGCAIRRPVLCVLYPRELLAMRTEPRGSDVHRRQTLKSTTTSSCDCKVRLTTTLISARTHESEKPKNVPEEVVDFVGFF